MHLLVAQRGTVAEGDEAIDLAQSPADMLFLSAADTELSSVAAAYRTVSPGFSLRLASLARLRHPMSVDTYVERTARHARLIVVRALGGAGYFRYALEALHAAAARSGALIAVLPGDDKPDPGLDPFCTASPADREAFWSYLTEGGAKNTENLLHYAAMLIAGGPRPGAAVPLLKAGLWWPGSGTIGIDAWRRLTASSQDGSPQPSTQRPVAAIAFYRALVQSGETAPVAALVQALSAAGLTPLPVFVSSLKDAVSVDIVRSIFAAAPPRVVVNTTGFGVAAASASGKAATATVLDEGGAVVLQAVLAGSSRETWQADSRGLSARDLAMHVALPEVDGRILTRAISFKAPARYDDLVEADILGHRPEPGRIAFVAELASAWARLAQTPPAKRRIALVMANYPNRDGRLGNGVGLDTPASTHRVLQEMAHRGYALADLPADGDRLMAHLMAGPTNAADRGREIRETISLNDYNLFFASLPQAVQQSVTARWGTPQSDPFFRDGVFALPLSRFGAVLVGIQPARGYNIDPKQSYHAPDLVPPHGYLAFYGFIRALFGAHAVIHMGKHGNLEWLPGKALALSEACYPEAVFGALPHLYPFIVNDPGEGTQAKRRSGAVIIDHLTPPLTRAESYGPLKDLEALVDEYYQAAGSDPRRARLLERQILDLVADSGLDRDAGIAPGENEPAALEKLDAYLCDLKEMQIRDGLHVFGRAPEGRLLTDLVVALARVPRGLGEGGDASLQRAIAADAGLAGFDPLDCVMSTPWSGAKPAILADVVEAPWRSQGDCVERIECLAASLVAGALSPPADWLRTRAVLDEIELHLKPAVTQSGGAELEGLLKGLDGRFVAPGPSGAPTRGRPDVLPTGRNFYSVDSRAVPTPAAYALGRASAELLIARYVQDHGDWPRAFGLTAWGTSNMRTGGDDIAQALALIGVQPVWEPASRRVTGYEIVPMARLGRPRVDVTLRISGFFRDAFPEQIALFDRAVAAVAALDEDEGDNPIAARIRAETAGFIAAGIDAATARRRAGFRVFGAKPGAYGAGLQALIDERGWARRGDLAESYIVWGGYAYGAGEEGRAERGLFEARLGRVEAVVQNQDNREHDLLDSDDYYQFEGGMTAAVEHLSGARPRVYHNDHSRPERPVVRSLEEEIGRVVRARVVNPKWIDGVMRHGYKGAFEITATVDYLFAFAATTGAVGDHHFDAVYGAFVQDERVRAFMAEKNAPALKEMAERLAEAVDRGLWTPRSNSARFLLAEIATAPPRATRVTTRHEGETL